MNLNDRSPTSAGAPRHASPLARLVALMRLERGDIGVATVYAIGVGLLSLATPLGVQWLVNTVAFGALIQPLVVLSVLVLAGLIFAGVLRALQAYVVEHFQQRLLARVALDLAHRLPHARLSAFDAVNGPELMNRFFDVMTIQKSAATMLVDGISITLQTVVGTLLLAFYHPFLLAFDAVLLSLIALVIFVLGRRAIPTAIDESIAKYALAAWLQETARHAETFKLLRGQDLTQDRTETLTRHYLRARNAHFRIVFRQLLGSLAVQAVASAALLGIGGGLVIARQLTLGQLVAAELIVTAVVAGFSKLGKYFESFYDLVAAVDKVGHMLDIELEPKGQVIVPERSRGRAIRAHDLLVRASLGAPLSLPAFDLPAGGSVAILGESGSGKSALVDALTGLRAPIAGRIDIDGIDINEVALTSFRRTLAIVRSDGIFAGTIDENIRLGHPGISRHEARLALERLGIWNTITTAMPQGLDTTLATHGKGLPSELAHLVVIARAIAARPRLLVIDGVLDALSPKARSHVRGVVLASDSPWSLVVTTANADIAHEFESVYALASGTVELTGAIRKNESQTGGA